MGNVSRRRMLQLTGVSMLGAAALAGCTQDNSGKEEAEPQPQTYKLEVYSPAGVVAITQHFVERLGSLEGKTIGFVSNGAWEEDRTFAAIQKYLEDVYHCTVIDAHQVPFGKDEITKDNNGVLEAMQALGVEAAIVGNAG